MLLFFATLTSAQAQDADGDTVPDTVEDRNGDGDPANDDSDLDGIPDYLDPDDDGDGVDTVCEAPFGTELLRDADGDTLVDGLEWFNFLLADPTVDPTDALDADGGVTGTCEVPWDRDSDGTPDALDPDDDGDGLLTGSDELGTDIDCLQGTPWPTGDGIPDYLDWDSDGDGILDGDEGLGDADGDFVVDFLDCDSGGCTGDSDLDGRLNCDEQLACPTPSLDCPTNPDIDGDGVIDGIEIGPSSAPLDSDGDGQEDWFDVDDDGDGLLTADEAGMSCADPLEPRWGTVPAGHWTFQCPSGPLYDLGTNELTAYPDTDGDGMADLRDPDDDGDGVLTLTELGLGTDPLARDSDQDGVDDGTEVGSGTPLDTDGDGVIDALDPDDDGDGVPTSTEGTADDDGDGVPAYLDPDEPDAPSTTPVTTPSTSVGTDPATTADTGTTPKGCACDAPAGAGAGWWALLPIVAARRGRRVSVPAAPRVW